MKSEIIYGIAILIALALGIYGIFSPAPGTGMAGLGIRISGPMILDNAISSSRLAASAIVNATDTSTTESTTSSTTFTGTEFSQSITLDRTSTLLMLFSAESKVNTTGDGVQNLKNYTSVRARVGGIVASPADVRFSVNMTNYTSQSAMFVNASVASGTYTVDIQFASSGGNNLAYLKNGTMAVIALPA